MPRLALFESKMRERTFRWLLNIFIALIIYCNAEAGRLLGIKGLPLAFSAVWPATGFSLASLLLFGPKCAPGVFWGNFGYNFLHLYSDDIFFLGPLLTAAAVSLGSFAQALIGANLIRRFTSRGYFNTMQDAVIFLLAGGLLTCLIAPTLGVTALYLYGALPPDIFLFSWLTFWVGDTMGVYIVTPLLVVWSLQKPTFKQRPQVWEVILMIILFALVSVYVFQGYPIAYLFLPLNIWIIYRFNLHGYTIAMAAVTMIILLPFSYGRGPFFLGFSTEMLLILVSFLETMVVALLLIAGALKERNAALAQLEKYQGDMGKAFKVDTFLEK
jgi:integral membrane sensor domain MASE1